MTEDLDLNYRDHMILKALNYVEPGLWISTTFDVGSYKMTARVHSRLSIFPWRRGQQRARILNHVRKVLSDRLPAYVQVEVIWSEGAP